jgi:predicted O-linked N-acetylglucosamine transferase (SPINDLY family)
MSASRDGEQMLAAALAHHRAGRLQDAERLYRRICEAAPSARAFHLAGVVSHQLGRQDAAALVGRAVALAPDFAEAHNDRGVILAAGGLLLDALTCFETAVALKPDYDEARGNLGRALRSLGRFADAAAQFEALVAARPEAPVAHFNLASLRELNGQPAEAERHYRRAIALRPDLADAYSHLAALLERERRLPEALASAERAIVLAPRNPGARNNLGNILRALDRPREAIAQYQAALGIEPNAPATHYNLGMALRGETRIDEARVHFARAVALAPGFLEARLARCMAQLPALYREPAEIGERRAAYAAELAELGEALDKADRPAGLVDAIGSHQPFYLPYQGYGDRELQALYGSIVCKTLAARYRAPDLPGAPAAGAPIRLAIVSAFFRQHANWKIPIKGWLKMLDRSRFHVSAYHTSNERDDETAAAEALCDRFVQGPLSLDGWRGAILDQAPHILLFPEIGMDKTTAQLAGQRLAPVQCASWGHPVTSGFPTIDYFISSDLMEPSDAAAHYSEKLVRLPNLSIYYEPIESAAAGVGRAELKLRADAVAYWCAQSLPKYLPQYDEVFPRIAREVRDSQFVFIEFGGGSEVTDLFKRRLERAFDAAGLDARRHCVFLPRLAPDRFIAAIGQCDVVLDSIGWSGCNSILESLNHNLPMVAFEGEMMRGRHAAAILTMMGIGDATARTIDDYVAIAVALGRDENRRAGLSGQIEHNKHRVYRDLQPVRALEAFLDEAVRGRPE